MTDVMKAIVQTTEGDPSALELQEVPKPELQPGEVLVKIAAAGVNRADLSQAQGNYPPPKGGSEIIGLECAGEIADAGDTDRSVGEKVGALLVGGGYAEYVAVPEGQLLPIPEGFSFAETAAVIETACTVWSNIVMEVGLKEGETILIHGGGGGIGLMAIQIAKAIGAKVAVTAGSAEKLEVCKKYGADILINYKEQDFAEELKNQCNVILDIIGGPYLKKNMFALAEGGRMVTIGLQGGNKAEINMGIMMMKGISLHGTTLRRRPVDVKAEIVRQTVENVWPMLEEGRVKHHIHEVLPLADASKALGFLEASSHTGTLVLEP
ncbi:NAD(P)H-quinone oxidoreductase [Corynebacterium casei]|uniref:NAD(P)H-quinone oxidoreductase n=1 Tax=Corynebacterium casei TaxID=160386 RepID=UPI003F8FF869